MVLFPESVKFPVGCRKPKYKHNLPEKNLELAETGLSISDVLDAGRMREQLRIARRIQSGFLPKAPPGLQGVEIEGWNEPCHEVGGDYYDFMRLSGGRLAIAIGDVASHGIGPALLMATARAALRALLKVASGPADVLSRLNEVLVEDMQDDHFMTMFLGIIDLSTKKMRYAIAGHERPLHLSSSGEFKHLDIHGLPLGIHRGIEYAEGDPISLRSGDLTVCLTDGIWEATNTADEEFGYDRLKRTLIKSRSHSATGVVEAVKSEVASFTAGKKQHDDLTLMVLKVL